MLRFPGVEPGEFVVLDGLGAVVLFTGTAIEDAHVDDGPLDSGRDFERRIFHVPGLVTENGPQQLFFRGELGLALGRDLADQDVVGHHPGPEADDAALVEVL